MTATHPRIRYGVVGLGHIAQVAVIPAFAHARRNSRTGGGRQRGPDQTPRGGAAISD